MNTELDNIFTSLQGDLQKSLTVPSEPLTVGGKGTIQIPFHLDGNGNYHFDTKKKGFGVTVNFTFWIDDPDAIYNIKVNSDTGGGGSWENVHVKDRKSGKIETSLWKSTTIGVTLHANAANKDGHATLDYSY